MGRDARILLVIATALLAGLAKGVTGMGVPVVATPVMAVLYSVRIAVATTIIPTVLSDLPLVYYYRAEWREARRLVTLGLTAVPGIVLGATWLLATVSDRYLAAALGFLALLFAVTNWFGVLPALAGPAAARLAPAVGLLAGLLQGATGASGPLISMYLFQLRLPRASFLFLINAYFLVVDVTQMVSLYRLGLYTPPVLAGSAVMAVLVMPALLFALRHQHRIPEDVFRRAILLMLAATGVALVNKLRGP